MKKLITLLISFWVVTIQASPLTPLKLDHPQDTVRSFYEAMQDYKNGLKLGDDEKLARIQDAIRTLDLSNLPYDARFTDGKKSAIFLKEVIDRILVLDFDKIPTDPTLSRWRLKDTEITVSKVNDGDHAGEFLISSETVIRASEFYNKTKHLPYLNGSGLGAGFKEPAWKNYFPDWMKKKIGGLFNWQWIGVLVALLFGFIFKALAEFVVLIFKKMTSRKTESNRHQMILAIEKPIGLIAATAFWYVAIYSLDIDGLPLAILIGATKVTLSVSLVWAAYNLTDLVKNYLEHLTEKTENTLDDQLVPMVSRALKVFVLIFGILITIQNLGFNVMSLLAGLGLGGLAFALAAKDTAANLFGSLMIVFDRPFKVGDWVVTSGAEGTVVEVGFRSTRIRTFYDSLISIPNSVLANAKIDNMGQRNFRRIKASIGITYNTPTQKIESFVDGIKNILTKNSYVRQDNYQVWFNSYGSSSLDIMLYCFLQVPDWTSELEQKQGIYMDILKLAESLRVQFAFPTQSIYVESLPHPASQ